jgi:hypothetical protein
MEAKSWPGGLRRTQLRRLVLLLLLGLAGATTAIAGPAAPQPPKAAEAPVIAPIDVKGEPRVNNPLAFGVAFTDIDTRDAHLARWTWGDGSQAPADVHCKNGVGNIVGRHAYRKPGIYTVQLNVLDSGGRRASVTRQIVVHATAAEAFTVSASGAQ